MTDQKKVSALVLSLGGAPLSWHYLQSIPGMYHPEIAVPVGSPGDVMSLEQAQKHNADEGCPLELVKIPASEIPRLRELADNARRAERGLPPHGVQEEKE